jgi:tripartite-type tricarboxylate transporter receptor subunit TctC
MHRIVEAGVRVVLACGALACGAAFGQAYPVKPITFIAPYAAGGTGELLGRLMAAEMSKTLGQNIVVELKPGAGGNIGAEYVAGQRNDGYTILFGATSLATNISLMKSATFDPRKSLVPVAGVGAIPTLAVVSAESPHRSMADIVAAAKKQPGAVTFGTSGPGTGSHLAGEFFKVAANIDMTAVHYKSTGVAYPDLIGNRVTILFDVMGGSALNQVRGGKVRPVGITSLKRSPALPDVPTVAEQGYPGFQMVSWFGFFAPTGTPPDVIQKLAEATAQALATATVKERFVQIAAEPVPVPTADFARYFSDEVERWSKLVREGRVKAME